MFIGSMSGLRGPSGYINKPLKYKLNTHWKISPEEAQADANEWDVTYMYA